MRTSDGRLGKTRLVYCGFLLILCCGYAAAALNLYFTHHNLDGDPALTVNDIVTHFHGNKLVTKLILMINGAMRKNLDNDEQKLAIERWVADGSTREGFDRVEEIFKSQCIRCHDAFGEAEFAPLTTYEEVIKYTQPHQGISWARIAKLSHQHLFGMGFIFFLTGLVLFRTERRPRLKTGLILISYLAILADIGGWWLTKLSAPFAYLVLAGGALSGICFTAMVIIACYEIWSVKE